MQNSFTTNCQNWNLTDFLQLGFLAQVSYLMQISAIWEGICHYSVTSTSTVELATNSIAVTRHQRNYQHQINLHPVACTTPTNSAQILHSRKLRSRGRTLGAFNNNNKRSCVHITKNVHGTRRAFQSSYLKCVDLKYIPLFSSPGKIERRGCVQNVQYFESKKLSVVMICFRLGRRIQSW